MTKAERYLECYEKMGNASSKEEVIAIFDKYYKPKRYRLSKNTPIEKDGEYFIKCLISGKVYPATEEYFPKLYSGGVRLPDGTHLSNKSRLALQKLKEFNKLKSKKLRELTAKYLNSIDEEEKQQFAKEIREWTNKQVTFDD